MYFRNPPRLSPIHLLFTYGLLISVGAYADGRQDISIRFAGGLLQNIEQTDFDMGMPQGTSPTSVALVKGKGSLGKVDIMGVTKPGPPLSATPCPGGFTKVADINSNNLLLTFEDLSMLWGDGQGIVCVNFGNGEQYVAIEGYWTGGSERFEGAGGEFSIRFDKTVQISPSTQFIAETGWITGYLTR